MSVAAKMTAPRSDADAAGDRGSIRIVLLGAVAFATLVDLFAAQAIVPTLAKHYRVSPGAMGIAVNASTLGMAIASIVVALTSKLIDRRKGIVAALSLLAIPTVLLAHASNLTTFALLRVVQGLCMATAFTLTLAWMGERLRPGDVAAASAAYITGNVASNLIGRMLSAGAADHFGLAINFYAFAVLNMTGAVVAYLVLSREGEPAPASARDDTLSSPAGAAMPSIASLVAACGIGFCILFGFIGRSLT